MAKILQFRRLSTAALANTVGANGELIVDSSNGTISVHNGVTSGGKRLATETYVVNTASQLITAAVPTRLAQLTNDFGYITTNSNITGGSATAIRLFTPRYINGVAFDGTANITISAANATESLAQSAYNQANSVYLPSTTRLNVTSSGTSAYLFDQYTENNATIYVTAGETIAFNLNVTGHPFLIRVSSLSTLYNIGLTHVTTTGTVTTNANAQGQVSGTLYWKVPNVLAGNTYVYQCQNHAGMVGNVVIQSAGYISLIQLKSTVANSANYAAFQSAIAAL